MKKILLYTIFGLLSTLSLNSQTLDGVLGIKFRDNAETVKKIMLKRDGVIMSKSSDKDFLLFYGGNFAGRTVTQTAVFLFKDRVTTVVIYFTPSSQSVCKEFYQKMKNEINDKYYRTDKDFERYKYPYEKDDGHLETAISLEKAKFLSIWEVGGNKITLSISKEFNILLLYLDSELSKLQEEEKMKINSKDY